jgi:hypothetical protein
MILSENRLHVSASCCSTSKTRAIKGGMRNILFAIMIAAVPGSQVVAEPSAARKPDKPAISGKLVPVKRTGSGNACAASGPGFAKVDDRRRRRHRGRWLQWDTLNGNGARCIAA